jgi:hypothetical protein
MATQSNTKSAEAPKNRQIVLPITESAYQQFLENRSYARERIDAIYAQHPELFPQSTSSGYVFNGTTRPSLKQSIRLRQLVINNVTYRIRPSFVTPYMQARTDEVWKGMLLMRYAVLFWVIALILGKNAMYRWRLFIGFSTFNLVGTTVKSREKMPVDVLADEYHTNTRKGEAYIATTVGGGCFLGVAAAAKADFECLEKAYGVFKSELHRVFAGFSLRSVNTDGWAATQKAWRSLWKRIAIVECFLHAWLKIRDRATKKSEKLFHEASDKVGDCYRAENKRSMSQRLRRLKTWALKNVPECPMRENIIKLCQKSRRWLFHLDQPKAHRTSNALDRMMKYMNRHAFYIQEFHSSLAMTSKNFRAFALLFNFAPLCPQLRKDTDLFCTSARLNGKIYHENWLHNLLISASLGGEGGNHYNPL